MADAALQRLHEGIEQLDLTVSPPVTEKLAAYLDLLVRWNTAYNLTSIRDRESMVVRHLLDALAIAPLVSGQRFIDVGTGAGVPGVPLAILQPERDFTLLDGNGKKTRFLFQVKTQLALSNIEIVEDRVERYQPRGRFDGILTRAFADLSKGCRLCRHLMDRETLFYAMKSSRSGPELEKIDPEFVIRAQHSLSVPFLAEERSLVVLQLSNQEIKT